jgi:flagellar biosynthesis chaperone FliJ
MSRLIEHPALAPLVAQKATLRQQLDTIADQVRALRQQLHDMSGDEGFTVAISRRTLQDQISEREREGAAIEEQLHHLTTEIARVEAPLREQVSVLRTPASVAVLEQFVSALEALHQASEAYKACGHKNYRLLQSWILPQAWLDPWLPSRVATARKYLEQLRQGLARLQD